jgi:predicted ATPase
VAAALDSPSSQVDERLADLARRGMMLRLHGEERWPDGSVAGRYGFSHALYRDVIYERIPAARRADLHGRIAAREEAGHRPDVAPVAARLAMHFEEAGDAAGAVRSRLQGARNAVELGAYREALTHASAGLASLPRLDAGRARDAQELGLQLVQATALAMTRGYTMPDAERAYARVLALGRELGDTPESALKGVFLFHLMRGELEKAQAVAEQFLTKATRSGDTTLLGWAHMTLGLCLLHRGAIATGRAQFDEGLVHYGVRKAPGLSAHQHDPGVVCHSFRAWCLWLLGDQAAALSEDREALRLAEATRHPLTQAQALACSVGFHFFRHDVRRARDHVDRNLTLSTEHGLTYYRLISMIGRGWTRAMRGESAVGLAELRGALDAFAAIGTSFDHTVHLTMLAEALERGGREDDALEMLGTALGVARRTDERFWEAEIHRRAGHLHLQRAERLAGAASARALEDAGTALHQALAVARAQHARSLELRAAMSLCRLSRHGGDRARAQSTLVEVYGSFTEGFDMPDLKEARALIRETGGAAS